MPELPEVETIRLGLQKTIIGQTIKTVEVLLPKMFIGNPGDVVDSSIVSVERKGKLLIISIHKEGLPPMFMTIHLKMTGQLLLKSSRQAGFALGHPIPPLKSPVPNKSTKIIFTFQSGDILYFNDIRTFGYVKVLSKTGLSAEPFLRTVGIEPLTKDFTPDTLKGLLKRSPKTPIKPFLLDQKKVAGIGNIYADEALFEAKILPFRLAGDLTGDEVSALHRAIQKVLERGISTLGASHSSYVTLEGESGSFLGSAAVYQRHGTPCPVCGNPIQKMNFRGRGTHYCPVCQV